MVIQGCSLLFIMEFSLLQFWVTESLFYYIYKTTFVELGALIGLSIGYILKYQLDKKYVFKINIKN